MVVGRLWAWLTNEGKGNLTTPSENAEFAAEKVSLEKEHEENKRLYASQQGELQSMLDKHNEVNENWLKNRKFGNDHERQKIAAQRGIEEDCAIIVKKVQHILDQLSSNPTPVDHLVSSLTETLAVYQTNDSVLLSVIDLVVQRAVSDPKVCRSAARLCSHLCSTLFAVSSSGSKAFRSHLMKRCQAEFIKASCYLKTPDTVSRVHGFTQFLGELYRSCVITQADGSQSRANILRKAVLDLLFRLVSSPASVDNIKCVIRTLKICGSCLEDDLRRDKDLTRLDNLFKLLDAVLLKESGRLTIKQKVTDLIGLRLNNWGRNPALPPATDQTRAPSLSIQKLQSQLKSQLDYEKTSGIKYQRTTMSMRVTTFELELERSQQEAPQAYYKKHEENRSALNDKDKIWELEHKLGQQELYVKKLEISVLQKESELSHLKDQLVHVEKLLIKSRDDSERELHDHLQEEGRKNAETAETLEKNFQMFFTDAQGQLQNQEITVQRLTSSLMDKDRQLQEYMDMVTRLNEKGRTVEMFFTDAQGQLQNQEMIVQQLTSSLMDKDRQLQEYMDMVTRMNEKDRTVEMLFADAQGQLQNQEMIVQRLTSSLMDKDQQLQEYMDMVTRLNEKVRTLETFYADAQGQLQNQEMIAQKLKSSVRDKDRQLQEYMDMVTRLKEKVRTLEVSPPLGLGLHSSQDRTNHYLRDPPRTYMFTSPISSNYTTSSGRRPKCRKTYGMENKESWCQQCKWKKKCTRYPD